MTIPEEVNPFAYKLPFMILNPPRNCRKMHFLRKMWFLGRHMAGNHRKLQEGFRAQESRTLANFHKIFVTDNDLISCSPLCTGRFANGYFRNGYFELQCEERRTFFRGLAARLFLSEGFGLFPPFLFLSGGVLRTSHRFSKYLFAKCPFASF